MNASSKDIIILAYYIVESYIIVMKEKEELEGKLLEMSRMLNEVNKSVQKIEEEKKALNIEVITT